MGAGRVTPHRALWAVLLTARRTEKRGPHAQREWQQQIKRTPAGLYAATTISWRSGLLTRRSSSSSARSPHPRIHTITIDRRADLDAAQVDQIAVFESPEQPPLIDHRAKQRFEVFAIGAVSRRRHAQEAHILQWTSESPLGRGLGVMAFIYNDNATSSEVASKDSKPMGLHDGLDPGNGNLMAPCFETRFAGDNTTVGAGIYHPPLVPGLVINWVKLRLIILGLAQLR